MPFLRQYLAGTCSGKTFGKPQIKSLISLQRGGGFARKCPLRSSQLKVKEFERCSNQAALKSIRWVLLMTKWPREDLTLTTRCETSQCARCHARTHSYWRRWTKSSSMFKGALRRFGEGNSSSWFQYLEYTLSRNWINKLFSEENKCLRVERWQGPPKT